MIKNRSGICLFVFPLAVATLLSAQEPNPTQQPNLSTVQTSSMTQAGTADNVPLYKIEVVSRDIPAINYFHRSDATHVGFQGTSLLPVSYTHLDVYKRQRSHRASTRGWSLSPLCCPPLWRCWTQQLPQ